MPELHSLYPGDELHLKTYPHLKQIIQLGHSTIRGVIKFKDAMVYANPKISLRQLPDNQSSDVAFESYQNGKEVSSYTSGDLVQQSKTLWDNHLSKAGDRPVMMSLNLETPLAMASFIATNTHFRKVYIPATFGMSSILSSIKTQKSQLVVCDQELYELEAPESKLAELQEQTHTVQKVVAGQTGGKQVSGKSSLFHKAEVFTLDAYRLE